MKEGFAKASIFCYYSNCSSEPLKKIDCLELGFKCILSKVMVFSVEFTSVFSSTLQFLKWV